MKKSHQTTKAAHRTLRNLPSLALVASLSALAPTGCIPAKYIEIPAVRGRVMGPDSQPTSAAQIHIVRDRDNAEVAALTARPDGTFDRPEQSHLTFQFAGADRALTTYSVTATAGPLRSPGTQITDGVRRWFFVFYDPPLDRDLGTLKLR